MNNIVKKQNRLPREVWVAGISLKGLWPVETVEKRMKDILERMENVYAFLPDIICLPEMINLSWVEEAEKSKTILSDFAEDEISHGPVTGMLAEVARKQNCYITCPILTKKDGHFYNSSILLNRQGKTEGVFHKVHPVSTEIIPNSYFKDGGVTPGQVKPLVYKTDFGNVGMQICFDANWTDSWHALKEGGAELVCFPSQGPFTYVLRNHAWMNHYAIVSATGEDAQIIDLTGDMIALDGEFARWVCAPLNFERVLLHIWPHTLKFKDIQKKYGRKIGIKIYHPENWATLESLDADIKVRDILQEYEIPTYDEQIREATEIQEKYRI
ncbi:MAG: carbon-nitrogen hydrolase family protein [Ferruginibacter sp.]